MEKKNDPLQENQPPEEIMHFWIKREDGIYSVDESVFTSFSMYQAISVAIATHKELNKQLLIDAISGEKKVKGIKITDALISSLNKLEELFPNILEQITMYTNNMIH